MSYPDDELKEFLRRKEPPAGFAARVMSRIEQETPLQATVHPFPLRTRKAFGLRLLAIAATIILMLLAGVLFFVLRRQPGALTVVKDNAVPQQNDKEKIVVPIENPTAPEEKPEQKKNQLAVNPGKSFQKSMPLKRKERREIFNPESENLTFENQSNLFLDDETARHLRKAQLLLRSFRNTDAVAADAAVDVAYEKQLSRELLNDNRLYRRAAEGRRNLPVKEVLSSLEPFLLDIANLSEKPSPDERRQIKERMNEKEIVAELQVYSTRAATTGF